MFFIGPKMKFNRVVSDQIAELIETLKPDYIVLDCDGTLYPNIMEARSAFYESLYGYFLRKFGYTKELTDLCLLKNKSKYDTVSEIAACLQSGINEVEFNKEVIEPMNLRNLGIQEPSPWQILAGYKIPVIIFTNNSSFFASLIAKKVGISNCVIQIFGESELAFIRKPASEAFKHIANAIPKDTRVLYFDDDAICLETGQLFGWKSIQTFYGVTHQDGLHKYKRLFIN